MSAGSATAFMLAVFTLGSTVIRGVDIVGTGRGTASTSSGVSSVADASGPGGSGTTAGASTVSPGAVAARRPPTTDGSTRDRSKSKISITAGKLEIGLSRSFQAEMRSAANGGWNCWNATSARSVEASR